MKNVDIFYFCSKHRLRALDEVDFNVPVISFYKGIVTFCVT